MTPDEILEARDAVAGQQQRNDQMIQGLARQGVQLDQATITLVRILVLLDEVLGPFEGDNPAEARVQYEAAVQAKLAAQLADVSAQIRQAQLLAGVPGLNGGRR